MMIVLGSLAAFAASPERPTPEGAEPERLDRGVHVVARGLVERYGDASLAAVYKSGTWLSGVGLGLPLLGPLGLDLEAGFGRLRGASTTFEIAPLSGLLTVAVPLAKQGRRLEGVFGAGPAWTAFGERIEGSTEGAVQGARIAGELRGGIRVDTGLVDPPSPPAPQGLVRRIELEIYLARRARLPGNEGGLSLGAWRGSLGIGMVF